MNRSELRRYEKEFSKVLKRAGDACGICRKPLEHNSRTFGGVLPDGRVALAGECCQSHLDVVMGSGVYLSQNANALIDALSQMKTDPVAPSTSDALEASTRLKSGTGSIEDVVGRAMQRAGVTGPFQSISFSDTPWKTDDAQWFKSHQGRSHRLRAMYQGEQETLPPQMKEAVLPDDHRWEILVRQIKQGQRVRTAFCRNTSIAIPDVEEVIHAIFDIVAKPKRAGKITYEEIAALASRYQISGGAAPN